MRESWDEYFIGMAVRAASRSTCTRRSVGAVIVRDKDIISTGYNGSLRGAPHCTDVGCVVVDDHCVTTVHAELNAILAAAKIGKSIEFGTMYVTSNPCLNCFKAIYQAGIKRIVYLDLYKEVDYNVLGLNINTMPSIVKFIK